MDLTLVGARKVGRILENPFHIMNRRLIPSTEILIEGFGSVKRVGQILQRGSVPITDILIEGFCILKCLLKCGYQRDIPIANILVEGRSTGKHEGHGIEI